MFFWLFVPFLSKSAKEYRNIVYVIYIYIHIQTKVYNNSRTKQPTTLKLWLWLVQMFKRTLAKFGVLPAVLELNNVLPKFDT